MENYSICWLHSTAIEQIAKKQNVVYPIVRDNYSWGPHQMWEKNPGVSIIAQVHAKIEDGKHICPVISVLGQQSPEDMERAWIARVKAAEETVANDKAPDKHRKQAEAYLAKAQDEHNHLRPQQNMRCVLELRLPRDGNKPSVGRYACYQTDWYPSAVTSEPILAEEGKYSSVSIPLFAMPTIHAIALDVYEVVKNLTYAKK